MYDGYLGLGDGTFPNTILELLNTNRVVNYLERWNADVRIGLRPGVCHTFLDPCGVCDDLSQILTSGAGYNGVVEDPAPWYDPTHDHSEAFMGILGLEIEGDDDSTQTANVFTSIGDQGVVGKAYKAERELTVRGLAVATEECGLAYGLSYLRDTYETQLAMCGGDTLIFFDCCPDCGLDDPGTIPTCWPDYYYELASHPEECKPDLWWPSTYEELKDGPVPPDDEDWCRWVKIYRQLRDGPPTWACDADACYYDALFQFNNVRVTAYQVLNRQMLSTGAWVAEVEFTVICADPNHYKTPEPTVLVGAA